MQLVLVERHDRSLCNINLDCALDFLVLKSAYSKEDRIILLTHFAYVVERDAELNRLLAYSDRSHHALLVLYPSLCCRGIGKAYAPRIVWESRLAATATVGIGVYLKQTFWHCIWVVRIGWDEQFRSHIVDSEGLAALVLYLELVIYRLHWIRIYHLLYVDVCREYWLGSTGDVESNGELDTLVGRSVSLKVQLVVVYVGKLVGE